MDQFYYESGYIDASYFVYTADAEAQVTSTASVTCAVGVIKEAASAMTVTAEITATISHIEGADLFAFTEAALAVQVDRIRDNNIQADSVFDSAIDGIRVRYFSADDFATSTVLVGDNLRVRYSEAAVDAAFSLTADLTLQPGTVVEASGAWSSLFEVDAKAYKKHNIIDCDVSSTFTQSTTGERIRFGTGLLEVNASTQATAVVTRNLAASVESQSDLTIPGERIVQGASTANSLFTPSIDAVITVNSFAVLEATSSLSTTATVTKTLAAGLSSQISISINADRFAEVSASLTSQTALSATGNLENERPWQFIDYGSPVYTSTSKVLGTGNLYLATTSDYLRSTSLRPEFSFGTDSFIIEFFTQTTTNGTILSYGQYNATGATGWEIRRQTSGSNIGFQFLRDNGNTTTTHSGLSGFTSADNWYIRLTRSGTNLSMVVRRLSAGTWSSEITIFSATIVTDPAGGSVGEIGGSEYLRVGGGNISGFVGYIDELYIAKGTTTAQQFISGAPAINTQGKEPTTLLLMHLDSSSLDDTTGTANAQASLTTQVSLTAQPDNRVKVATADLQVQGFVVAVTGRIRPEVAALDSQFVVNAVVSKLQYASADLSSQFSLTANVLDLDLGQVTIETTSSLSVTIKKIAGLIQNLSSQVTINAQPDAVFLTLSADGVNPAGYITSPGPQIATWQDPPIQTNFWIKLDQGLTSGQQVIVYQSGTNQIILGRNGSLPDGSSLTGDVYWIITKSVVHFNPVSGQLRTIYYGCTMPASSFDPTVWHNIHMPLRMSKTIGGGGGSNSNIPTGVWGNVIMIDGQDPSAIGGGRFNNLANLASTSIGTPASSPKEYSRGGDGGQWGHSSNLVTLYLDQIWVKTNEYLDPINETGIVPIESSDFINADGQTPIHLGLTPSNIQGQVWLPFRSLLDYASTSPTWDYVANNTVSYGLIKTAQASINSQFTQTTAVARVRPSTGAWTSTASLNSSISRTRPGTASLSTTNQLSINAIKVSTGQVNATVQASLTAPAIKTAQASGQLDSNSVLSAQAVKYRPAQATVSVQASLSSNPVKTVRAESSLIAQTTLSCQALRIKQIASDFSAIATELAAVVKVGQGFIHSDIVATLTAGSVKTTSTELNATITSQLTASPISTSQANATLSTTAQLVLVPTYLRRNEAQLVATAQQTTAAIKTTSANISLTSQASTQLDSTNSKVTGYSSDLQASTALVSDNQIVRLASANLNVESQVLATVYSLVQMQANLQVQGFVLTAGRVLHIDEFNQLKIKGETRFLVIHEESRLLTIKGETRVNKIKGYNNDSY